MFGPLPESIYDIVHESLKYRKMAHTAEEITRYILEDNYGIYPDSYYFSDIRNGFVLKFYNHEEFDIQELEDNVREVIDRHLPVAYYDEEHITIGERIVECRSSSAGYQHPRHTELCLCKGTYVRPGH